MPSKWHKQNITFAATFANGSGGGSAQSLSPPHGNQLIWFFHIEPPHSFRDSRVDVGRLDGAEPFLGRCRTHNVDVPLRT